MGCSDWESWAAAGWAAAGRGVGCSRLGCRGGIGCSRGELGCMRGDRRTWRQERRRGGIAVYKGEGSPHVSSAQAAGWRASEWAG